MRIAINTRFLLPNQLAGIGNFTHEVFKRLCANHSEHDFVFIFDRPFDASFIYTDNIEAKVIFPPARHPFLYYWWFEFSLPRLLKKEKIDLFISPDNSLSLKTKVPTILVIHDLAFEHYPMDNAFLQRQYYKYFTPKFAKRADHIIAVSNYTKTDIVQKYGIKSEKISVVLNGLNSTISASTEKSALQAIKEKYTFGSDYFIHVGTIQPRKNIVRLFQAFDSFKKESQSDTKLLIVGKKGWKDKAIYEAYQQMAFQDDVLFTGYVENEELSPLYSAAIAAAFISYFEGFGFPVIEAQACDCPVICSNVSSIPEVAGDAAIFIDPFSVEMIKDAMLSLFQEEALRQNLIKKGKVNIQRFSWEKSVIQMEQIIKKVSESF